MAPRKSATTSSSAPQSASTTTSSSISTSNPPIVTAQGKVSNTKSTATAVSHATSTTTSTSTTSTTSTTPKPSLASVRKDPQDIQQVAATLYQQYVETTPQRTKLVDVFLGFLMVVGGLQFVYCVVAGNYPFNAFLAGFSATVGQFVLTASLRIQTNPANSADFEKISHERAFADYIFGSMILHFFCVNFIN